MKSWTRNRENATRRVREQNVWVCFAGFRPNHIYLSQLNFYHFKTSLYSFVFFWWEKTKCISLQRQPWSLDEVWRVPRASWRLPTAILWRRGEIEAVYKKNHEKRWKIFDRKSILKSRSRIFRKFFENFEKIKIFEKSKIRKFENSKIRKISIEILRKIFDFQNFRSSTKNFLIKFQNRFSIKKFQYFSMIFF